MGTAMISQFGRRIDEMKPGRIGFFSIERSDWFFSIERSDSYKPSARADL
jgi:hypothetical protein